MRLNCKGHRGVTLVELILAMILMSVVVLTGVSMEMGLRRLYLVSDRESELMGEAGAILSFVSKKIHGAFGTSAIAPVYNSGVAGQYIRYRLRRDVNQNGVWDGIPPDSLEDFYLCWNWGTHVNELWFGRNGGLVMMLSEHAVDFRIDAPAAGVCDGCSFVQVTLRQDPTSPVNGSNPEITLNTTVQYRGVPLQ